MGREWLREITEIVCPKCKVYYLIRDMHKHKRAEKIKLESGKKIKIGKIKKYDVLECIECGIIRKYKGEKTIPYTEDNYRTFLVSHGNLQHRKYKEERKEKHLARLHALKRLKYIAPYEIVEEQLGREYMILSIMEGITRVCYSINIILLSVGHDKSKIHIKLLEYLMKNLKEKVEE